MPSLLNADTMTGLTRLFGIGTRLNIRTVPPSELLVMARQAASATLAGLGLAPSSPEFVAVQQQMLTALILLQRTAMAQPQPLAHWRPGAAFGGNAGVATPFAGMPGFAPGMPGMPPAGARCVRLLIRNGLPPLALAVVQIRSLVSV